MNIYDQWWAWFLLAFLLGLVVIGLRRWDNQTSRRLGRHVGFDPLRPVNILAVVCLTAELLCYLVSVIVAFNS